MIWARWAGVMGVPMKWEIARIFVVGTGGSGFCAEAAPSGVIGFFMAVAPLVPGRSGTCQADAARLRPPKPLRRPCSQIVLDLCGSYSSCRRRLSLAPRFPEIG